MLAYTVSRRTQELGIRRALGAQPSRLLQDVVVQGMQPVVLGLVCGIGRVGVDDEAPADPSSSACRRPIRRTYVAVALAVVAVALLSCLIPALRALRVNPVVALRAE